MCVRSAAGIGFEFVVTPTLAANIKAPFSCINRRTTGAIELVAPNQLPCQRFSRADGWTSREKRSDHNRHQKAWQRAGPGYRRKQRWFEMKNHAQLHLHRINRSDWQLFVRQYPL